MSPAARRALVRTVAVVAVVLGGMTARALVESRAELVAGTTDLAAGDTDGAIFHLRSAGRWDTPGNPWSADAVAALLALGADAEAHDQWLVALEAYDAVRAASLGARSFYTPHAAALATANERLPAVMARAREIHPVGPRSTPEQRPELEARFRADLAKDRSPAPVPATLAVLCFAGWIGAMAAGIWRSIPDSGPLRRATAARWGGAALVLLAAWLGFLAMA